MVFYWAAKGECKAAMLSMDAVPDSEVKSGLKI